MKTGITHALLIAATLCLAACNRSPEPIEDPIADNLVTEVPIDDAMPLNNSDIAEAENAITNIANTVAPPEFSDIEQMRDDADATGLTARLPTEEPANETQPVQ